MSPTPKSHLSCATAEDAHFFARTTAAARCSAAASSRLLSIAMRLLAAVVPPSEQQAPACSHPSLQPPRELAWLLLQPWGHTAQSSQKTLPVTWDPPEQGCAFSALTYRQPQAPLQPYAVVPDQAWRALVVPFKTVRAGLW